MKKRNGDVALTIILVIISMALYATHLLVFRNVEHVTIFALSDFAFMPIEVIFVTLIFHRVLASNEKKKKISKLYMVIETFFSEVGTELLRAFAHSDTSLSEIENEIDIKHTWSDKDFKNRTKLIEAYCPEIKMDGGDFEAIDMMLQECRPELLRLLENPTLLEHETFTEVLMAVFHLAEELRLRYDFRELKNADNDHLIGDVRRAYILLGAEWVNYINHMRVHYPYLYSLSVRNNPFKPTCDVQIKE